MKSLLSKKLFAFIITLTLGVLFSIGANAQVSTTTSMNNQKIDADMLLKKSKKQKTTAWILLGGGTAVSITTILIAVSDPLSVFEEKKTDNYGLLFITGAAGVLGSIPFFIASGKNKRKANLLLKGETGNNILYKFNYPALALVIKL